MKMIIACLVINAYTTNLFNSVDDMGGVRRHAGDAVDNVFKEL